MATSSRTDLDWRRAIKRAAIVVFWLAVWQLVAAVVDNSLILAGPVQTASALAGLVEQGRFWLIIAGSFGRIVIGFLLAFVIGIVLASAASRLRTLGDFLQPLMAFIKSTPVVCIVVLLLIWFGSRQVSSVAVFLVVLPAIYFSASEALANLDAGLDEMLRVNGVRPLRRALAFVWPSIQPFLLATSKLVVGMSWKAGVAAELIGTPLGSIGERIYQAKILLETADLFAWTFVVIILAFVCEKIFLALLARSADWTRSKAMPRQGAGDSLRVSPAGLSLDGARVSFGGKDVLHGITRSFPAGSRTCVLDASGAGKTTTLRVLAGLQRLDSGSVGRCEVSMDFQDVRLFSSMSAVDNVRLVAGRSLSAEGCRDLLGELLPDESLDQPAGELSGGMQRRVELCRAIAVPSQAVLLDEPFASLDSASHEAAAAFVTRHLAGRTLVVATHDANDAKLLGAVACHLFDGGAEGAS